MNEWKSYKNMKLSNYWGAGLQASYMSRLENYKRIDLTEMKNYIQSIKDKKYDYENDEMPNISKLLNDIKIASSKMLERVKKFNIILQSSVFIELDNKNIQIVEGQDENRKLYCNLDLIMLRIIIDKKAHCNNAEIGTHIEFKRLPNKMDPDVHICMSFFHL